MANKFVDKLDITEPPITGKEVFNYWGNYYEYRLNWLTQKSAHYQSNCPYYQNPGFVCPLSANRDSGLFVIN